MVVVGASVVVVLGATVVEVVVVGVVVAGVEVVGVVVAFTVVTGDFTVVVVAAVAVFTFPRNVRVGRTPNKDVGFTNPIFPVTRFAAGAIRAFWMR
jgi:hypothetical protein